MILPKGKGHSEARRRSVKRKPPAFPRRRRQTSGLQAKAAPCIDGSQWQAQEGKRTGRRGAECKSASTLKIECKESSAGSHKGRGAAAGSLAMQG